MTPHRASISLVSFVFRGRGFATDYLKSCALGILVFIPAVLGAMPSALAQGPPMLWEKVQGTIAIFESAPEVVDAWPIKIDVNRLQSSKNTSFILALPDGEKIEVVRTHQETIANAFVWHGKVKGARNSSVSFSVVDGLVAGSILTPNGSSIAVRQDPSGVQVIEEIDLRKLPREEEPTPATGTKQGLLQRGPTRDTCTSDSADRIDLMVAYTTDARSAAGGKKAMQAEIALGVSQANLSFANSAVSQRVRLVHTTEVPYAESGRVNLDRDRLYFKTEPSLIKVHRLRDDYGADVILLITKTGNNCGIAFIMETVRNAFEASAVGVVKRSCATRAGIYTITHELGHIMSARHDWKTDAKNNKPFKFNHGHVRAKPSNANIKPWRTIMSHDGECNSGCPRILQWSNPGITWGGDPTGVATGPRQQDNHKTLNRTAQTVANFRCAR